jgi:hypothetical protein
MKYISLLSVPLIVLDTRYGGSCLGNLLGALVQSLADHCGYHVLILCKDRKQADEFEELSESCGFAMCLHADYALRVVEEEQLRKVALAWLISTPDVRLFRKLVKRSLANINMVVADQETLLLFKGYDDPTPTALPTLQVYLDFLRVEQQSRFVLPPQ